MTTRLQMLVAAAESGDAEAMTDLALVHARGEELQRVDLPTAIGWYSVRFSAILHELGHLFCRHLRSCYDHDWQGGVRAISHAAQEFEAETVSWLVCRRLGVDNPSYQYLAHYFRQNNEIPREVSVDEILKATRLAEMVLEGVKVEDAWLYKKCAQFKKRVEEVKAVSS